MKHQYKYIFESDSEKCIVTSIEQLIGKTGLTRRQISYAFKKKNVLEGEGYRIERVLYYKDTSKVRKAKRR